MYQEHHGLRSLQISLDYGTLLLVLEFKIIQAFTQIDTVTNLAMVICIDNESSVHINMLFESNWLANFPCPSCCNHKNDVEFTGTANLHMFQVCGIKDVTTTVKNPQATLY